MNLTILIVIAVSILIIVLFAFVLRTRIMRKLNFMIDALEDSEVNFRYLENGIFSKSLNKTLNRIKGIFSKERELMAEQEVYFKNMLNHVNTGIIAIRQDGMVEFMNNLATDTLQTGVITSIRQLKNVNRALYDALIGVRSGKNIKVEFYNESSKKSLLLSASYAVMRGKELKIIAMNDISAQLNENEEESWSKLTRVLTHEIMNTITPIASLSDTLVNYSNDLDETMKDGLSTISTSSKNLIKFVESYRNLTRIPQPNRTTLIVKDIAQKVLSLMAESAKVGGVEIKYIEHTEDILLYADEGQISQILINLVKNAIQACATKVVISAEIDATESVVINVSNNGAPIEKEDTSELFVPFYTTKTEGTGIGLSISRQIMRMHGGQLNLTKSDESATVFTLIF